MEQHQTMGGLGHAKLPDKEIHEICDQVTLVIILVSHVYTVPVYNVCVYYNVCV